MAVVMSLARGGLIVVQSLWIQNAYESGEAQFNLAVSSAQRHIIDDVLEFELLALQRQADQPFPYLPNSALRTTRAELDSIIHMGRTHPAPGADTLSRNVSAGSTGPRSGRITDVAPLPGVNQFREQYGSAIDRYYLRASRGELSLQERIGKESFEYFIQSELLKSGIDVPYEYAVLDFRGGAVYRSPGYARDAPFRTFELPLFAGDRYVFTLYFPHKGSHLLQSVVLIAALSILLILVLVTIFIVSIYTIVHQKKLSEMRTDFMNNVTHELKTPISTISLASQMLGDSSIPDSSKNLGRLASVISHESKRLGNQVEKVLQMAIFENGRMNLRWTVIDVNQLLETVVENVAIQVTDRKGTIDLYLDASQADIRADEIHFTNVLFNLVDNAMKYSQGAPCIEIFTRNVGKWLSISVKDRGIGIPKSDQKRIFDQFYRVHTGNVHNVKGFGLGLSYVQRMIAAHKGRIELESEVGVGTTFTLYLPLVCRTDN